MNSAVPVLSSVIKKIPYFTIITLIILFILL